MLLWLDEVCYLVESAPGHSIFVNPNVVGAIGAMIVRSKKLRNFSRGSRLT